MKPRCFICYRDGDEPFAAALIDRSLVDYFGPGQVFRDSRTIPPGADFPPKLWGALRRCRALLVVIGPRWLRRRPSGGRLIDNPYDYVRREVAVGLRRGIPVIPVLAGPVRPPRVETLPADIAELASRQYMRLRVRDVESVLQRLIKAVEELTG